MERSLNLDKNSRVADSGQAPLRPRKELQSYSNRIEFRKSGEFSRIGENESYHNGRPDDRGFLPIKQDLPVYHAYTSSDVSSIAETLRGDDMLDVEYQHLTPSTDRASICSSPDLPLPPPPPVDSDMENEELDELPLPPPPLELAAMNRPLSPIHMAQKT